MIAAALLLAPAAGAQSPRADSAAFVTRLGSDTLVVERFVRHGARVDAEVLSRVPRTSHTTYTLHLDAQGHLARLEAATHGGTRQRIVRDGDSLRITIEGEGETRSRAVAADGRVLPFIDMVHWPFDLALARLRASGAAAVEQPLLTGSRTSPFRLAVVGPDSMTITHPTRGTMRVHVDAAGRILHLDAGATTRKLTVERTRWVNIDGMRERWAALDAAGKSLGALSGRAQSEGEIGGATLTADYGTPQKRGRAIWGALVPYGTVWRTGANQATHFSTSRDLVLGAGPDTLVVPAGDYTLFSIPAPDGGVLIVNRQTGQTGTAYDASRDLGRVRLTARPLAEEVETFTIAFTPDGRGGAIRLQWDRTELVVPVRVR